MTLSRRPAQHAAIGQRNAGEAKEEGAMTDDGDAALRARAKPGPEAGEPRREDRLGLDGVAEHVLLRAVVPPGIGEMVEGEGREVPCQRGGGTADIAAALQPLAMQRLDEDRRCRGA